MPTRVTWGRDRRGSSPMFVNTYISCYACEIQALTNGLHPSPSWREEPATRNAHPRTRRRTTNIQAHLFRHPGGWGLLTRADPRPPWSINRPAGISTALFLQQCFYHVPPALQCAWVGFWFNTGLVFFRRGGAGVLVVLATSRKTRDREYS